MIFAVVLNFRTSIYANWPSQIQTIATIRTPQKEIVCANPAEYCSLSASKKELTFAKHSVQNSGGSIVLATAGPDVSPLSRSVRL
jgi:hypothetical protein